MWPKPNVDWKERHDKLAKMIDKLLDKRREVDLLAYQINNHIEESNRLNLQEQGKSRYLRLKEDCDIQVRYDLDCFLGHSREPVVRHFEAGTLVDARIRGGMGTVYLDESGDGFLDFPANLVEEVEVLDDEIDWTKTKVVSQG